MKRPLLSFPCRYGKALLGAAGLALALGSPASAAAAERDAFRDSVASAQRTALHIAAAFSRTARAGAVPDCSGDGTVEVRTGDYTPVFLICSSSAADGPPVVKITDRPDHGHLDADLDFGLIYYVPDPDYVGTDSFKAVGTNAAGDSAEETFTFNVTAAYNTAPVCADDILVGALVDPPDGPPTGHINARKGMPRVGGGGCTDFHDDAIAFEVVQPPSSGTLSTGTDAQGEPTYSYTPAAGVADGTKVEAVIRPKDERGAAGENIPIGFTVRAANHNAAPVCPQTSAPLKLENGEPALVRSAFCTDLDGDSVTPEVVSAPAGTSSDIVDGLIQLTASVSTGSGTLTHRGTDMPPTGITPKQAAGNGSVPVDFVPAHADPTCTVPALSTTPGTRTDFEIPCADADGDAMTVDVLDLGGGGWRWAQHGDLEIRRIKDGKFRFAYIPDPGFTGTDTFRIRARDGFDVGATQPVSIDVRAASTVVPTPAPTASPTPSVVSPLPVVKPPALLASDIVSLPSAKRCVSRRRFRIRLRAPKGVQLASAEVFVGKKRVKAVKGKRLTAPIDLRGLPKGRFTVKVVAKAADGRTVTETRRYRTCAPRKKRG